MFQNKTIFVLLFFTFPSIAATDNHQIALQAADCLTGHIALETEQYKSGKTQKYFLFIQQLEGAKQGMLTIRQSLQSLQNRIKHSDHNKIQLANRLLDTQCPKISKLLQP